MLKILDTVYQWVVRKTNDSKQIKPSVMFVQERRQRSVFVHFDRREAKWFKTKD